jgi:hypothetical protein
MLGTLVSKHAQSQTFKNDCKELANAIIDSTPAEQAAGTVSPGGISALKEMHTLIGKLNSELLKLTSDMGADFALK